MIFNTLKYHIHFDSKFLLNHIVPKKSQHLVDTSPQHEPMVEPIFWKDINISSDC